MVIKAPGSIITCCRPVSAIYQVWSTSTLIVNPRWLVDSDNSHSIHWLCLLCCWTMRLEHFAVVLSFIQLNWHFKRWLKQWRIQDFLVGGWTFLLPLTLFPFLPSIPPSLPIAVPSIVLSAQWPPLSLELAGLILPHEHAGSHLIVDGTTADTVQNTSFKLVRKTLAEVWSDLLIDGSPVKAEYIDHDLYELNPAIWTTAVLLGDGQCMWEEANISEF